MPNHDTKSLNSKRLTQARRIVRAELNSYDALSRKAKLRFEPKESRHSVESRNVGPEVGYVCGHRVSLTEPCDKCKRSTADCVEYQVALATKLKELLSQLNKA